MFEFIKNRNLSINLHSLSCLRNNRLIGVIVEFIILVNLSFIKERFICGRGGGKLITLTAVKKEFHFMEN